MKILYGIQGTGNGHISRAREMARVFQVLDCEVDYYFSGRAADKFFDMSCFGDFQVGKGLTFVTEQGCVQKWKTWRQLNLGYFRQEVKALDLSDYDLVLNDFEPVTAWAAKQQQVPSLSLSHQAAFLHYVPKVNDSLFDRLLTRYFAPTQYQIGLHWYHFNCPILPPIIPCFDKPSINQASFILVYLPFESLSQITELLSHFQPINFVCYHPDIEVESQWQNVQLKPLSRDGFHHHLHQCKGVVANGGFELPSEAISLGKKLLLKPLQGQFEQSSNVATLAMMGLAHVTQSLDITTMRVWLDSESVGRVKIPDVASEVGKWLLSGDWDDITTLQNTLWSQVEFPELVCEVMSEHYPESQYITSNLSLTKPLMK
ncbi:MJ1255/VC2487 family glycosyltransferase [Photobacterium leiognathi]|uniref:MJ1255/VC2487 family glycosyltransferase n=1 Tax=Photobacterium leiognathi TaxID=553611 RepID=UPI0029821BD3|nr:MJ1255/VC2487 family glycosyltransferase [Photobacterium leiognathi]